MSFFISEALADGAVSQAPTGPGAGINIAMLIGLIAIFYFLVWRPQSKRAKEHKELVSSLKKGDEIITNAGILGKITQVSDDSDYIKVEISNNVEIKLQKAHVLSQLPKGTLKDI